MPSVGFKGKGVIIVLSHIVYRISISYYLYKFIIYIVLFHPSLTPPTHTADSRPAASGTLHALHSRRWRSASIGRSCEAVIVIVIA